MDANQVLGFIVGLKIPIKLQVIRRYFLNRSSVAGHRGEAAVFQPDRFVHPTQNDSHQHDLVIASQRHDLAALAKLKNLLDHVSAIGTAIDVVAEENDFVIPLRFNRLDERSQCLGTTVNVADDELSHEDQIPEPTVLPLRQPGASVP